MLFYDLYIQSISSVVLRFAETFCSIIHGNYSDSLTSSLIPATSFKTPYFKHCGIFAKVIKLLVCLYTVLGNGGCVLQVERFMFRILGLLM